MSSAEAVRPSTAGAWLQLARVSNTPTVVSNTVAGAVLASAAADAGTVAVVAVAMALFYTAGMILNDVLDLEVDRASGRSGRCRPAQVIPQRRDHRGRRAVRGRRGAARVRPGSSRSWPGSG